MEQQELERFKEKLEQKKSELISLVQKSESYGREAESEEESKDYIDKASSSYSKELHFRKSNNDRQLLQMVIEALKRIDSEEFGTCLNCEEPVEAKRLEAVPWARLCLACQELQEKGRL